MKPVILYVGGFSLPDKNAAAHRVLANGKILEQAGYDVHYIGVNYETNLHKGAYEKLSHHQAEIGYPKKLSDWVVYLGNIDYVLQYLKNELSQKPVAVFCYNYPSFGLLKLQRYCKKHQIKIISDCTEWYQPTGNLLFRLLKGTDTSFRMRYVHPKLDGMIAISRYLYDYYAEKMANVVLVPPLKDADEKKFSWEEPPCDNIVRFVYAGSPGDAKDKLSLLMEPLSQVARDVIDRSFQFDIIGLTEEQYCANFQCEIPANLRHSVRFLGRLPHEEVIWRLKQASFSVFVREDSLVTRAGFPTKFAEAITCGTPVVTNASSNVVDYLTEGENGFLLDIVSRDACYRKLRRILLMEDEHICQMKKNCWESKLFHYANYIEPILQLIE